MKTLAREEEARQEKKIYQEDRQLLSEKTITEVLEQLDDIYDYVNSISFVLDYECRYNQEDLHYSVEAERHLISAMKALTELSKLADENDDNGWCLLPSDIED